MSVDPGAGCLGAKRKDGQRMRAATEAAVRNILSIDTEVKQESVEKAIAILRGEIDPPKLVRSIPFKTVRELLGIHRRTLDYYLSKGYLDRVYGGGTRAIGVTQESFERFTSRTIKRPKLR